jgi:ankyrin repeat protein
VKGANIHAKYVSGKTALHAAASAREGEAKSLTLLLEKRADPQDRDNFGATPLHVASERDNYSQVELSLDEGADLESQDNSGATSIHVAATSENYSTVGLLLDRGASIDNVNDPDMRPRLERRRRGELEPIGGGLAYQYSDYSYSYDGVDYVLSRSDLGGSDYSDGSEDSADSQFFDTVQGLSD